MTRVSTGLSGITSSSPALSVASRAGLAAFSVYEEGNYNIYTVDVSVEGAVAAEPTHISVSSAATLPPLDRRPSEVHALLKTPVRTA